MTTNQKITVFSIITLVGLFFVYNFYFSPSAICINEYKKFYEQEAKQFTDIKKRDEWLEVNMRRGKLKCTLPK